MGVRLKSVLSLMALVAASTVSTAVTAQERPATFKPREAIPDVVNRAFNGSSEGFQDIKRPIETLIGIPKFPENGIAGDGDHVDRIYRDLLNQQVANDPIIRTVDLPNPYSTSVLTLPSASVSNRLVGSELVFER
jgi:hypothetical protein